MQFFLIVGIIPRIILLTL